MVQPVNKAYGIKKGENTSLLSDAVLCDTCAKPEMKARKFLNLRTSWDSDLADVTTSAFKTFKNETEVIIDKIFEDALIAEYIEISGSNKKFDHSSGYYGTSVLSAFETGPEKGAGRKKRAIAMENKIGVEIEVAMKLELGDKPMEALEKIFSSQLYPDNALHSTTPFTGSTCDVTKFVYDTTKLDFMSAAHENTVDVGMKLYLECKDQYVMNRNSTYDPEDDGLDVICNNNGTEQWQGPTGVSLTDFTGCIPTPMCGTPPAHHPEQPTMLLLDYVPVNKKGSFPVGESVFYGCNTTLDEMLDDNSGMAVFELACTQTEGQDPSYLSTDNWPQCAAKPRCREIPNPDSAAKLTGLELDPDTKAILLPGEFAIYNCTDSDNPVTDTGAFFSVECINGLLATPSTGNWPHCRAPSACNTSATALPVPPADTFLTPQVAADAVVMELETITYNCSANPNKTFIEEEDDNMVEITCLPGAVWPSDIPWRTCLDSTTTTPKPTTSTPSRRKGCYCLGDRKKVDSDNWKMNTDRHLAILNVCRGAPITFPTAKILPDLNNNKYIVPIKEQCGVLNPYVREYGQEMEGELAHRELTVDDTCACHDDTIVGYWITLNVPTLKWKDNLLNLESKTSKLMIAHIEDLFDNLYLNSTNWEETTVSPESRFVRTRVMRFKRMLEPLLNQEEYEADPDNVVPEYSVMVQMEFQYAQEVDEEAETASTMLELDKFKDKIYSLFEANNTLSMEPLPLGTGITIDMNCTSCIPPNECACKVEDPQECLNKDFTGIPEYLTHQFIKLHPNGTKKEFPYNVTQPNGETKLFSLRVGETVDIKCDDPLGVKIFQTQDPELLDNILTIVCKPDKYYNVPSMWPVCKAQCPAEKPLPDNSTRMILDVGHREMTTWDQKFWEDERVYYKCEDSRNEGVVTQPHLVGPDGGQVGDKRKTTLEFKCTADSSYNTPLEFPNCAPKRK